MLLFVARCQAFQAISGHPGNFPQGYADMPRFLSGFILGVVVTYAALTLLDTSPEETEIERASHTEAAGVEAAVEEDGAEAGPVESASIQVPPTPVSESVDATPSEAASPRSGSVPPPKAERDVYSPEIAEMLEKRVPRELQERYESEAREDSWATYMEGQLAAYFAQKPQVAQFNISLIDCRSSICEIHAVGYGPSARADWITATSDIGQQPWHQFNQGSMSTRDVQPDVFAVVWILARSTR